MTELPPLDQPQAYVVVGPNDQRGPYTMELLLGEVIAGRLSEATPVWWPGLADWTTMGGHPGVAAELARRRGGAPAPGWAGGDVAAPVAEAAPAPEPVAPAAADPFAAAAAAPAPGDGDEIVDAEVIEATVVDPAAVQPDAEAVAEGAPVAEAAPVVDGATEATFAALVARSSARAELQARIDAVQAQLVDSITAGVVSVGLPLGERVEVDRGTELRFDGSDGDLAVVSLGRPSSVRPDDLRFDHVPVTVSYRSAAGTARASTTTGDHGEVVVSADEWTGQTTSSVSLFLDLGTYLDESLSVDGDALAADIAATVTVLRSRLA